MTPAEKLQAEIDALEEQLDKLSPVTARYIGSGEDGATDPEVEEAMKESARISELLDQKYAELRKDDPYAGVVGATPADPKE